MQIRFRMAAIIAAITALYSVSSLAQPVDFDVLVDTDRNPVNGCTVTPSGNAPVGGFEHRIRASVDLASYAVVALERSSCSGGSFGAPSPVPGVSVPYPLALNSGTGGADAVELAVARSALGSARLSQLRLAFVTDNGTGSDLLATTDGSAAGGPILFGLPVQIPALSIWGLGALVLILLGLAFVAQRRMGRIGAVMAVTLVATAVWAMNFALDGDLGDWGGAPPNATDPGGDATDGSAAIDLLAGFVALSGGDLFFRMDVSDAENQPPVAVDDAYSTVEDTALSVGAPGVLSNDSDAELDPITAVLDAGPANAQSFTLNADGSFDYTPNADFDGSDSFTYFANDGQANSAPATVTITVNPINDPPVALNDNGATQEDQQVDVDVLANDSDVDGSLDPATVTVTSAPASGTTSVNMSTGVITYTKSADFNGADSFDYEVCDDGTPLPALCATATVSITIDPVNDAPSFTAGNPPAVDEDAGPQTVNGWVTSFDPGPDEGGQSVLGYIVSNISDPGLFSAGPSVDAAGNLSYTPAADAFGSSTFDVAVRDDGGTVNGGTDTSPAQTFTITVNPIDDPPVAVGDSATVDEDDSATTIDVLANDNDIDGGPIGIASVTQPANGAVVITNAGADLTYQSNPDFCNDGSPTDDFSYTLNGGSSATVAVAVTCVNDPPVVTFPTADVSFDPNVGPVNLDPGATLTDIDSNQFNRVETTLDIGGMCDLDDTLTIENQGGGPGQIGFDGTTVTFEGTPISTAVQPWACTDAGTGAQDAFIIQLDTSADQAATEALLRALQFSSTSADSTSRTASAVVADDANATGSAGQTITLVRAPAAVADSFTVTLGNVDSGNSVLGNDDEGVPAAVVDFYADTGDIGGASEVASPGTYTHPTGNFTVSIDGNGDITIDASVGGVTPNTYSFDYQITNGSGSSVATVTVAIVESPGAADDEFAAVFDAAAPQFSALDLTANNGSGADNAGTPPFDSIEFGGGDLSGAVTDNFFASAGSITVPFSAAGGSLTLASTGAGTLTFSLAGTTSGTELIPGVHTFQYQLTNSQGTSGVATVTLNVQSAPIANNDGPFNVPVGNPLNLPAGTLFNDNGAGPDDRGLPLADVASFGGGDLGGSVTTNPVGASAPLAGGTLLVNADGSLSLTGTSVAGTVTFAYRLTNTSGSDDATVTVVIEQSPTANDDTVAPASNPGDAFHTALDTPLSPADGAPEDLDTNDDLGGPAATIASFGAIQTNDGTGVFNAAAGTVTTNPQGTTVTPLPNYPDGSLVVNDNGTYTFDPPSDYAGLFAFAYRLSNSAGTSDATVTLAVGNRAVCSVDAYTGTANIDFAANAAGGTLANDTGSSITVSQSMGSVANVGSPAATTSGGSVTLNADGSFDYSPPAGVTGANADSFSYAIANGFGEVTTNCTANITLNTDAGTVPWFVSRAAGGANLGTFADPFTSIAAFNAVNNGAGNNPGDGDIVYVVADLPGFYNEADGINLRAGQEVYGGTVQFNTVFTASGSTSAAYNSFAATTEGGRTEIRTTGDDAFDIGNNNTIRGFTIDSTAGYAFADNGGNIGTTTVSDVSTFNNGGAFNLQNGGTINATLDRMSAFVSTGTPVIALNGIAGSIADTTPGGIIHTGNGNVFDIRNGTVSVTVSSPVTKSAGTGTAIFLNNADGTISFSGVLAISSGTAGINVENGSDGTLNITNTGSSIQGIQGIPFRVNNSTMGIDYNGDITHTQPTGSLLSSRTVELIGATGTISLDGTVVAGNNIPGNEATGEVVFLSSTGSANTIRFNDVDAIMHDAPAFVSQMNGNVAMDRLRARCTGNLSVSGDTHCVQVSDTTSSGFTIEALTSALNNQAGDFGGALSLVNTTGVWTVEDISGGLFARSERAIFGNTFGTLNLATVNSGTSPGGVATGTVFSDLASAIDLENGTLSALVGNLESFNTATGLRLVNVGGAGLEVQDGQIPNMTADSVVLTNTGNVTLNSVEISGGAANGIRGQNVTNFTLSNSVITNQGDAVNEGGLRFDPNLLGTATISNSSITGSAEHNIEIINTSGVLSSLNISGSTIGANSAALGADGLLLETRNSAQANVVVTASTFNDNQSDGIQISAINDSVASLSVNNSTFTSSLDASPAGSVGARGIVLSASTNADLAFDIGGTTSNLFENFSPNIGEEAINVTLVSTSTAASLASGRINNNVFTNSGGAVGIDVRGNGALVMEIDGNTATTSRQAIDVITGDAVGDAASADLTITNNSLTVAGTVANPNNEAIGWLGDRNTVSCLNIRGNTGVASGTRDDIILDDFTDPAGALQLESGAADCGGACATSEAHLLANNTITDVLSSATLVAPGTCATVP